MIMEIDTLVNAWIEETRADAQYADERTKRWAIDQLIDYAAEAPETLFKMIVAILETDTSDAVVHAVGEGPLEDLVLYHGDIFMDRIQRQAAEMPAFKRAMCHTFLDASDTAVFNRFYEIAGVAKPHVQHEA